MNGVSGGGNIQAEVLSPNSLRILKRLKAPDVLYQSWMHSGAVLFRQCFDLCGADRIGTPNAIEGWQRLPSLQVVKDIFSESIDLVMGTSASVARR